MQLLEIKLLEIILGWFKPKTLSIKLPTCYTVYTNTNVFDIEPLMMKDIKEQATKRILEDPKLLKRVNKEKILLVTFQKSIPIGINVMVTHSFYWNGESLFSMINDSKSMSRDIKLEQILK